VFIKSALLLFLSSLVLISCSRQEVRGKNFLKDPNLSNAEKLERYLNSDSLMGEAFTSEESQLLRTYYEQHDYQPFLLEQAASKDSLFNRLFERSLAFGIPREYLELSKKNAHPVELDMVKVLHVARMVEIRDKGFLDTSGRPKRTVPLASFRKMNVLTKATSYHSAANYLLALGPKSDTSFKQLSDQIFDYGTKYKLDTANFSPKNFTTDEQRTALAKSSLKNKGYITSSQPSNATFDKALLLFKLHNGLDSSLQMNNYTVEALCESNVKKLNRAALSLDKIRHRKNSYGRLVLINLPEYMLYFYANDNLKAKHRLIIGKRTNETPELESEIRSIVVYPYWSVPASIVKKEIMPKVRKNKNYLAMHHYTIRGINDTSALDVSKINLKANGYSILQSPGKWNSLGVLKFEFNNRHSVYVHDTPQKGLFNRAVRSFSHGCMRCEFPKELGKQFLTYDQEGRIKKSMPPYKLDTLLRDGKHRVLPLKTKIPIKVCYQTVCASADRLVFYIDIYGRDSQLLSSLKNVQKFNF
jgi:murein L,D-transpeptidase YcbB/YkuD